MNVSPQASNRSEAGFHTTFHEIHGSTYLDRDAKGLARLGKSQVLKLLYPCYMGDGIIVSNEPSALRSPCADDELARLFTEAFTNAPISGGQYFWTAILAPRRYKRFCGYLIGWLTSLAWIATLAIGSILVGRMVQALIILNYPDYQSQKYHGAFLSWAVIVVCIFVNTVVAGILPFLEGSILIVHIMGFIAIMVTLVYLSPHTSAEHVFLRSLNEGYWPTQGLSYCVGFIGNVATFVGKCAWADAAIHMAEEIENAAMNVPRAIVTTVVLNGSMGWAMVLAILFCLGDIDSVIVHAGTRVPVVAVIVVATISSLLNAIYIGSSTAFSNVISMSVSGLYASYLLPCSFLLWRRVTGQIKPYRGTQDRGGPDMTRPLAVEDNGAPDLLPEEQNLEWGPWCIPGWLGILNNSFACLFCVWVLFWDFWPTQLPVTAQNMNFSILVTGLVEAAVSSSSIPGWYAPPGCFIAEEDVLLDGRNGAHDVLIIDQAHGDTGPVWPAVVFHEEGCAATRARPTYREFGVVFDVQSRGNGPPNGIIVKQSEDQKRIRGDLAAFFTMADGDRLGQHCAFNVDHAAQTRTT
ncbi:hypothetical protein PG991_012968 [Apiospora marii]|uniref:Amino acid transporter n=1 Tax=Apiospora marii TaxID=335849 RepID=A0ABR1RC82_9PEZI